MLRIGQTIAQKRREKGVTQEQVAAAIGVSAPAVSKWETGQSYPDIMLLPPLARYFECSVDALLAYEAVLTDDDLQRISDELRETLLQDGWDAGVRRCEALLREHPRSAALRIVLTSTLAAGRLFGVSAAQQKQCNDLREKWLLEAVAIGDAALLHSARLLLGGLYMGQNRLDEAEQMLEAIPERMENVKQLMPTLRLAQGRLDEAARLTQQNLLMSAAETTQALGTLSQIAEKQGDLAHARRSLLAAKEIAETLGAWTLASSAEWALVRIEAKESDVDAALCALERYAKLMCGEYMLYGGAFFSRLPDTSPFGESEEGSAMRRLTADDLTTNEAFAPLRAERRFEAIIQCLRSR